MLSTVSFSAMAISESVGSRPSSCARKLLARDIRTSAEFWLSGMRTLRVCSAKALRTGWRTHHTAYEMNLTPWSGSNFLTALSSPSLPIATSSERSNPCPWYFFTYEITKRRLAVTRRSAARSSPAKAQRASRFSSSGSEIIGSFWMSSRYWSNAPEGVERANGRAFPVRTTVINNPGRVERCNVECGDQSYSERNEKPIYERSVMRSSKDFFPHHKMLLGPVFVSLSTFWNLGMWPWQPRYNARPCRQRRSTEARIAD